MNKYYGISKLTDEEILNFAQNYFGTIAKFGEISADETKQFLLVYLEFVLRINNIKSEDYNLNIHLTKRLNVENVEAYLHYLENKNKFDVYFLRDDMKLSNHNGFLHTNMPKEKRLISRLLNNDLAMHHLIFKLTISGHEFQHIVQLINNKGLYMDYVKQKQEIATNLNSVANMQDFKILAKTAQQNLDDINFLHPMEIEANMLSYKYMLLLLKKLCTHSQDESLKHILGHMIEDVQHDREDKYTEYFTHNLTRRKVNSYVGNFDLFEENATKLGNVELN